MGDESTVPAREFAIRHRGHERWVQITRVPECERAHVVTVIDPGDTQCAMRAVAHGGWMHGKLVRLDAGEGAERVSAAWPEGLASVVERACREVMGDG